METIRLASPWLLALLAPAWAAILYFVLAARPRRAGAWGRAALLCLASALLVLAAARPSVRVARTGDCPVLIVQDVSPSMQPRQHPVEPGAVLVPYVAALPTRRIGLVQDGSPLYRGDDPLRPPGGDLLQRLKAATSFEEAVRAVGGGDYEPPQAFLDPARFKPAATFATNFETDIESALMNAADRLRGSPGIVVLYSDALQTHGDAVLAASGLASMGIQVHAIVPPLAPRDVRIAGIDAPAEVAVGKPIRITVRVASTVEAQATVRLARRNYAAFWQERADYEKTVSLGPAALAEVTFEDTPPQAEHAEYQAEIESDADDWPENNHASRIVIVGDQPGIVEVLYDLVPAEPFRNMLQGTMGVGSHVTATRAVDFRPAVPGSDIIILDNVSAAALGKDRAEELARLVADGGLGLLVLGGDEAFSAGGYAESPLEDLLPVTSRTGKRPPMEIVFVVDSSGSMNETVGEHRKITLAKQAVLALRPVLAEGDRVGIIAFAAEPRTVSPLVPVSAWDTLAASVREIEAGGGTRLTAAVEAAAALFGPRAEGSKVVRHIILLSDGRSDDFDVPRLAIACQAAGASVSTVATGTDADLKRLAELAQATGGRAHGQQDLAQLAATFTKDMTLARGEGMHSTAGRPEWVKAPPVWRSAGPALPPAAAFNPTEAKDGADVLWSLPVPGAKPAPALAVWQRGLGRVAAMPWPVDRATREDNTKALAGHLRAVLAWLNTPRTPPDWSARVLMRDGRRWVRVEERAGTIGKSPEPFILTQRDRWTTELVQVAPGIHEAAVLPADMEGLGEFISVSRRGDPRTREVLAMPDLPEYELERFGVDRAYLEEIVRAGGGMIHSSPQTLAQAVAEIETRDYAPVGLYLVGAALGVVLLLAGLRLIGRM